MDLSIVPLPAADARLLESTRLVQVSICPPESTEPVGDTRKQRPKTETEEDSTMTLDEIKAAIRSLRPDDRRKLALYILEIEKDTLRDNVVPQITEDLEGVQDCTLLH
jgi:hypothetical protein